MRPLASYIVALIEDEINNGKYDFATEREAFLYYSEHCKFPHLLMAIFKKQELNNMKACSTIERIINGEDGYVHLKLVKKGKR